MSFNHKGVIYLSFIEKRIQEETIVGNRKPRLYWIELGDNEPTVTEI